MSPILVEWKPLDFNRFAYICVVLKEIFCLTQEDRYSTKRDIYYKYKDLFECQRTLDRTVSLACNLLNIPRKDLHILASPKGLLAGSLIVKFSSGVELDCSQTDTGAVIPNFPEDIQELISPCQVVLVVEKDAVFQKLLDGKFMQLLQNETDICVLLVTARGYPDVNTRKLLKLLDEQLRVPTLCLTDADPHGVEIMLTYRFGPKTSSQETMDLEIRDLKWIGLLPSDIDKHFLTNTSDLEQCDRRKLTALMNRECVRWNQDIFAELNILKTTRRKAEIEALSDELLVTYLQEKIVTCLGDCSKNSLHENVQ